MECLRVVLVLCGIITITVCSCPTGWELHASRCYHFSHDEEDWTGAMQMCKLLGGNLLEVNDEAEGNFIASRMSHIHHFPSAYMALSDVLVEGEWQWMVSETALNSTGYANWAAHEPNNVGQNENCALIRQSGEWNDDTCFDHQNYVCERDEQGSVAIIG